MYTLIRMAAPRYEMILIPAGASSGGGGGVANTAWPQYSQVCLDP